MPCNTIRNLDISVLRSFVTIAELGGITRAADKLNLTQSAVSMQVKRLEAVFNHPLIERRGRGICLTREGEQLLSYGRRIIKLNDEAWQRMTHEDFQGQVSLGVPEDLIGALIPTIMRDFGTAYPMASIHLATTGTRKLKVQLNEKTLDVILTTEALDEATGECLYKAPMRWFTGADSQIYAKRPLPLAYHLGCIFMPYAVHALDSVGITWQRPYDADDWRDLSTFVSAGLAVQATMANIRKHDWHEVPSHAGLPSLPDFGVFMYIREDAPELALQLAGFIRDEYYMLGPQKLKAVMA